MNNSRWRTPLLTAGIFCCLLMVAHVETAAQDWVRLLHPNGPVHHQLNAYSSRCDSSLLYRDGHYYSGDTIHILWDAAPEVQSVSLSYSSDDGVTWMSLARDVPVGDQPYIWVAPERKVDTPSGWFHRVRVEAGQYSDSSDKSLAINARPFIRLTYPKGGDVIIAGDTVEVEWEWKNVNQYWLYGYVYMDYSTDGGVTWNHDINPTGYIREGGMKWSPRHAASSVLIRVYGSSNSFEVIHKKCLRPDEAYGYYGDTVDAPITITSASSVPDELLPESDRLRLLDVAPNPIDRSGMIRWVQGSSGTVTVRLFDAGGRVVQQRDGGNRERGEQSMMIDVDDLPPGIYFCEVRSGGMSARSMVVVAR